MESVSVGQIRWVDGEEWAICEVDGQRCRPLVNGAGQDGTTLLTDGWPKDRCVVIPAGWSFEIDAVDGMYQTSKESVSEAGGQILFHLDRPLKNATVNNAVLQPVRARGYLDR